MNTKAQLQSALKDALRAGDDRRKTTLSLALSAIKFIEIEKGASLDEPAVLSVIQKEIKTRHESIDHARRANRPDLEAEALAQLNAALTSGEYDWYAEGQATMAARGDYVRERLRLFFVGLTRAKRELILSWNTGRQGDAQPSLAMQALMGWWESVSGTQ